MCDLFFKFQLQNASAKPSSIRNQRLLVKVIKANSLGDKDFGE